MPAAQLARRTRVSLARADQRVRRHPVGDRVELDAPITNTARNFELDVVSQIKLGFVILSEGVMSFSPSQATPVNGWANVSAEMPTR